MAMTQTPIRVLIIIFVVCAIVGLQWTCNAWWPTHACPAVHYCVIWFIFCHMSVCITRTDKGGLRKLLFAASFRCNAISRLLFPPKLSHGACILLSGVLCESHASGYEATCHRANIPPEISSGFDCLAGTDCLPLRTLFSIRSCTSPRWLVIRMQYSWIRGNVPWGLCLVIALLVGYNSVYTSSHT